MGKKQKNALLDDALCEVIDAHQDRSGATFARICSAALIQYLFSYGPTTDSFWMQMALALEKGEASIRDIAKDGAMHSLSHSALWAGGAIKERTLVKEMLIDYREEIEQWFRSTADKDPVGSIVEWWDQAANRQRRSVDNRND